MPRRTLRNRRTVRGGAAAKAENNNNNWNNNNNKTNNKMNKKTSKNACRILYEERNEALEVIGEKNLEIRQLKREVAELHNENNLLSLRLVKARNPRANVGLAAARLNSTVRSVGSRIPFRRV